MRRIFQGMVVVLLTFVSLETALRVVPSFLKDPLKSLLQEAQRIPLSNTRIHSGLKGGVRIALPPTQPADLLVVGASMSFGTYVREEDTFARQIQNLAKLTSVNLSVAGSDLPSFNRMVEVGSRYGAHDVLYCLSVNDFVDQTDPPRKLSSSEAFEEKDSDHKYFITDLTLSAFGVQRLKHLANFSLLYQLRKLLSQPVQEQASVAWQQASLFFMFAPLSYWQPRVEWKNPSVQKGLSRAINYVSVADQFMRERGGRLHTVLIPSKEMVYAELAADMAKQFYVPSHYETYEQLSRRLKEKRISVLDLTPKLRGLANQGQKLYHSIDGHFNEQGHSAVAQEIAAYLKSLPPS